MKVFYAIKLLLEQNAYSGFSHPSVRKMPCESKSEIERVVKSGGNSDGYTRLTH